MYAYDKEKDYHELHNRKFLGKLSTFHENNIAHYKMLIEALF